MNAPTFIPYKPRAWFAAWHERTTKRSIIVAHRRAGKSYAHIQDAVRRLFECELEDPRGAYIGPLYRQTKRIAWSYLKNIAAAFGGRAQVLESELTVIFPGNRAFTLYGADRGAGEALRGTYLDVAVIDEPESISGWESFYNEVLLPTLADRDGHLMIIGTVKGRGVLYHAMRKAQKNPSEWYTQKVTTDDTDVFTPAQLAKFREEMGDAAFRQEYLCDWNVEGPNQFISGTICEEAALREPAYQTGDLIMGVDVARFGDDRSVILVRNSHSIDEIEIRRKMDLMQLADLVAERASKYKPVAIFVDAVGVGAGVVDALRRLGFNVIEVHSGAASGNEEQFVNRRAESWWKMREWIKVASLKVPTFQKELIDDLTCLRFEYDPRNRFKMESKDRIKARGLPSPDLADALALTFAQVIAPKEIRTMTKVAWAAPDASPFEGV